MIDSATATLGLILFLLSLGINDTVHLASALPTITDSLVITGLPCQNPTIDGDSLSFNHPAFYATGSKPLTLNYLNIFNCKTSGSGKAGAVSAGYLYMNYCFFYGNSNISDSATAGTSGWLTRRVFALPIVALIVIHVLLRPTVFNAGAGGYCFR